MGSVKNAFFPWPVIESHHSSIKSKSTAPESKLKGRTSQNSFKPDTSIPQIFTDTVRSKEFYPSSPAIYHHCKVKMSFKTLDEVSSRIGKVLARIFDLEAAVKPRPNPDGDFVLAFILTGDEQDEKMISLIFAILKMRIAYMALSPSIHPNDLTWALNTVKPILLLSGSSLPYEIDSVLARYKNEEGLHVVPFQYVWNKTQLLDERSDISLNSKASGELWGVQVPPSQKSVAIFFTAGSFSTPHPVRVGTKEIINRLHWAKKIFPTEPGDAYALTSSVTDPRSLIQILTPLLEGKPLTIIPQLDQLNPERLADRVAEVKLTRITLTPPTLENLLNFVEKSDNGKRKLLSITHWTVSGGALKIETGRKFFQVFSGIYKNGALFLITMYGTTEVLGEAAFEVFYSLEDLEKKMSPGGTGVLSSGIPIRNTSVAIVDRYDRTLPQGQRGEIIISGLCLTSGYVGHSHNANDKNSSKNNFYFRTGDIGRILQDPKGGQGTRRLYVEGRFDNESIQIGGHVVNLQQWATEVLYTKLVTDCAVFTYHRGRDNGIIVAAVVLKPDTSCVQVLDKLNSRSKSFTNPVVLPTVFAVDVIPLLENGRVDKKHLRTLFRQVLLECEDSEWAVLNFSSTEEEDAVKFMCKAVSLSIGLPLSLVVRRAAVGKSFWDVGGNPLNAVIVASMCRTTGYPLQMKHFVTTRNLLGLADVMRKSRHLSDAPSSYGPTTNTPFDERFSISLMTEADIPQVTMFLKNDTPSNFLLNPQPALKYWRGVLESVHEYKLSIVVRLDSKIVGVAITGDIEGRLVTPKPPKDIAYGLEMLSTCLQLSKYQQWRKSSTRIARIIFLGVSSASLLLSPGEKGALIDLLYTRTLGLSHSAGYPTVVIATTNPLVQEVGIHLHHFHSLLECPVAKYKSPSDGTRPFTYADDNHSASVLIKSEHEGGGPSSYDPSSSEDMSANRSNTISTSFRTSVARSF